MELLSDKLNLVKTSATAKINNLVLQKEASGERIMNLAVGEPNFTTPNNIKLAGQKAIQMGLTSYTPTDGLSKLKQAIIDKVLRENSLIYDKKQIIICSGGKQVIFNALMATLNAQDEVVITSPYWVSYPDIVNLCGGKPVIIKTNIANNFKVTVKELKQKFNSKTKWFIINSPSNPSGTVYSKTELFAISKVLKLFPNINIISDDIYEHIIYESLPFYNLVQIDPQLKHRTLLVNGVSKGYAMTGWRLGYGLASENLIKAMTTVQSQSTSNASTISQYAAIEALTGKQDFIENNKLIYQNRRDQMLKILKESRHLDILTPMGSFYALPSIDRIIGKSTPNKKVLSSDTDFVFELLNNTGVAVVPGSAFGAKNTFRISYAVSESLLEEACRLIVEFVDSLE